MYHLVFATLTLTLLVLGWFLVHSVPPLVSRILPRTLTFLIGASLALLGGLGGFMDAYYQQDAAGVFGCFVMIMVGHWFMLAPSSGLRGTYRDEALMKRVFIMMGVVFFVISASMYLPEHKVVAFLNLLLITGGFWFTTSFLREVDGGR
jgi:hypothetical protein